MLEHVLPPGLLGTVADILNPLVVRMVGTNINRYSVENAQRAGLSTEQLENLSGDLVKLIIARPAKP